MSESIRDPGPVESPPKQDGVVLYDDYADRGRGTPVAIATKMVRVAKKAGGYIQKGSRNQAQGYNFVSAEDVATKIGPLLVEEGIATQVASRFVSLTQRDLGKGPMVDAVVVVRVTFVDSETGQSMYAEGHGSGSDKGDKAIMKAHTAAQKYAYLSAFQLATGDDPEADRRMDDVYASEDETPRAKRGRKPKQTPSAAATDAGLTLEAISAASHEELAKLREALKKLESKDKDAAKPLISAYKARVAELNPPTAKKGE